MKRKRVEASLSGLLTGLKFHMEDNQGSNATCPYKKFKNRRHGGKPFLQLGEY